MKLRDYLLNLNMTQGEFATMLGINTEYLNCIIRGKKKPGKHLALVISNMTNGQVDAEGLITGAGAYTGSSRRQARTEKISEEIVSNLSIAINADNKVKKR